MKFKQQHPIYLQITDHICEKILAKEWLADAKIASIREMAVDVEVNPNTAARSYDYLEGLGIIYTQRGIGYFVAPDAIEKITNLKKERFLQEDLPQTFKTMRHLSIDFSTIQELHQQFNNQLNQPNQLNQQNNTTEQKDGESQ